MNYDEITNPKIKAIIDGLKYNSVTIENDMQLALDDAKNEEDFILSAQSFLDNLKDEMAGVNQDLIQANNTDLIIYVEGGVIQDITGLPEDINVKVVDWDVDGIEENRLTKLESGMALVSEWKPDGSAEYVKQA